MDLRCDYGEASGKAISKFFNAKTDDPVYIFETKVAGRTLFAVLTAQECKDAKIKPERACGVSDGRYGLAEYKNQEQKRRNDPKLRATVQYIRASRQKIRALQKLEKMERGEQSPERPTELPTTEA